MLLGITINSMLLSDVNRRSLYACITVLGHTTWVQWWPRPIPGRRMLTCGTR